MSTWAEMCQESSTYQATLRRGWAQGYIRGYSDAYPGDKLEAARRALLVVAEREFGQQPPPVIRRVSMLGSVEQIVALVDLIYCSAEGLDLLEGGRPAKPPIGPVPQADGLS